MAIIVTSAGSQGSILVNNSSASPQVSCYTNLYTTTVSGDAFQQTVNILNSNQQNIVSLPIKALTVGSSGSFSGAGGLQNAVLAINSLIIK